MAKAKQIQARSPRKAGKAGKAGKAAVTKKNVAAEKPKKKDAPIDPKKAERLKIKKEYQNARYNKKPKKNEEEDDAFEIVPSQYTNDIAEHDESDDDSDLEVDMFSNLKGPTAMSANTAAIPSPTEDNDQLDSDEEEARALVKETMAANRKNKKSGGFQSMGLSHPVYKAILHKGFKVPTPIQRKSIPLIMERKDVVGMARTGSGKTAAFLIPLLERLKTHSAKVGARGLVLSPSRELALQTQKVCNELGKYTDLRTCVLVGGDNLDDQFSMLAGNPDILIATPGRLLHLMVEMNLDFRTIEYVVFDEADRLFEMGFSVQLHEILAGLPPDRQTLLFSATLPRMLVDFAKAGLQEPSLVRLDADTKISKDLEMAFFSVRDSDKTGALLYLLRHIIKLPVKTSGQMGGRFAKKERRSATEADRQTILFAATKHQVELLATILSTVGYQVSYVYGSLDQTARNIQIGQFRSGITNLLIVTDVAARGIDIPILENVINYDFCGSSKIFVHRVGRAARAGRRGWAYSLVSTDELPYLLDLELFLTRKLHIGLKPSDNIDYTDQLVMGSLPEDAVMEEVGWVNEQIELDASLGGIAKTAANAYKLYNRTKPQAAPESYARAKKLIQTSDLKAMHPLAVHTLDNSEAEQERLAMIQQISGFKPQETIFEVGHRGAKSITTATTVMRQRRHAVDKRIDAFKSKHTKELTALTSADTTTDQEGVPPAAATVDLGDYNYEDDLRDTFHIPSSSTKANRDYRDKEFYISYTQKDANTERGYAMTTQGSFSEGAQAAQLDLAGDDSDALRKKQNQLRWDSKKHKFVRGTGIGADNKKLIRTESGALISASFKSGRFEEWSKKTHTHLPRAGEQELRSTNNPGGQKRFRHSQMQAPKAFDSMSLEYEKKLKKRKMFEEKHGPINRSQGRKPQSELKTAANIRKDRALKEKRRAKSGRAPRKQKGKGRK